MDTKTKYLVYIGDFDFRNENVQSYLVRNNGRILNSLGFRVVYIGINTKITEESGIDVLLPVELDNGDTYYELPDTLNLKGGLKYNGICKKVICYLNRLMREQKPDYLISYQAPTYSLILKRLVTWCKKNEVKYIVNCADLPTFELQPCGRRQVMEINWRNMHRINKRYADGVISVSRFISDFYFVPYRPSVIIPPLFDYSKFMLPVIKTNDITSFIYAGIPFKITGHEVPPAGMKDRLDKIIDMFIFLSTKNVQYSFKVVGITKEDYLISVPRHQVPLAKDNKIEFLGQFSHKETLSLVAQSDFSINYRDENLMTKAGFSTKIVESISVGTPVVTNSVSDINLYLQENTSWIELNGNILQDADTIYSLCALSKNDRIAMKKKLISERVFDWCRYQDRFSSFLDTLMTTRGI